MTSFWGGTELAQPVKLRARVESIVDHAPGLRTLWLKPERQIPRFKPGQFLHLALDPYDPSQHWPDSRCFSIASPPEQRDRLRIVVSAKGVFTQRIMQLKQNDEVWIKLPYGEFVIEAAKGQTVVLVAGGTGISPFMSLLGSGSMLDSKVRILYGAREPALLIEREELDRAARVWPDLAVSYYTEQGAHGQLIQGRLSAEAALEAARADGRALFYLSGPPAMLHVLRQDLASQGVEAAQVRVDAWE